MAADGGRHPRPQHAWPTDFKEAARIQKALAGKVLIRPLKAPIETVAAVDVAFIGPARRPTHLVAGVVVYHLPTGKVLERQWAESPVAVPYVPGFLSFRETPTTLAAIEKLTARPDVFLIDGQGLAHPRRFGIACHVGVLLDRPTIGCAKSRLVGEIVRPLAEKRGSWVELVHQGEPVGAAVRTRQAVKPVYVSVGHRITLAESIELVLRLAPRYRLPEPARIAHHYVTQLVADGVRPGRTPTP